MEDLIRGWIVDLTNWPDDVWQTDAIIYSDRAQYIVVRQLGHKEPQEILLTRSAIEKLARVASVDFSGKKPGEA